jgi:hypothetical protein
MEITGNWQQLWSRNPELRDVITPFILPPAAYAIAIAQVRGCAIVANLPSWVAWHS